MPRDAASLKIFIAAGEASGDVLGARLMRALKQEAGGVITFKGVGGPLMEAEGLQSLFPMRDLSVMGIAEVLPRLNKILKRIRQTADNIIQEVPDLTITIDSPDFSFRVAERVRKRSDVSPLVHYVAPTVWAWRPERAAKMAKLYDGLLCLYPFEPDYFTAEGLRAVFAGHPAMENSCDRADGGNLREGLGIPANAKVLGIMFGSRMSELNRVGPVLREAAEHIAARHTGLHILSPTFPHLERQVVNLLQGLPCKWHVLTDQGRKWDSFAAMDFALATSGTVGLELAIAGVPHVIAYKMNRLTWQIVRRKVTVKYAHLANLLLDKPVVPEFIQTGLQGDEIGQEALALLENKTRRQAQLGAFEQVRQKLAGDGAAPPSVQAARFALDVLYSRSSIGT